MLMYPLKFKPIYKRRIWGGQKLREIFNKDIPPNETIGESWELADMPEDKSVIANGPFAGRTIDRLIAEYPKQITGSSRFTPPFGLLIKLIDAQDILSIQVHPDADTCRRMGKGQPKTECWYIIAAGDDAIIYKGLEEGVTKEQFARAIENGTAAQLCRKVKVRPGECHLLPAGTVHATGPGLLIAEIQTPSDTTYRVFDWNRIDPKTAKPRLLHIPEALESMNFGLTRHDLPVTTVGRLADTEFFKIDKGHQAKSCELLLSPGKMKVIIVVGGAGRIAAKDRPVVNFEAGETLLVPAEYEGAMCFESDTEYLVVTIKADTVAQGK